jgi:hypothetical protein
MTCWIQQIFNRSSFLIMVQLLPLCKGQAAGVPSLLSKMFCKSHSKAGGDVTRQLRTQQNIECIFEEATLQSKTVAKIILKCDAPCFHPTFDGNDLDLIFTKTEAIC